MAWFTKQKRSPRPIPLIICKMTPQNIEILKNGGVGVIPTDTIYGIVGRADLVGTVKRISKIKNRSDGKGFIVIISSVDDLKIFGIEVSDQVKTFLNKFWPGKVSVEFFYDSPKFSHIRRSEGCNAFRLPNKKDLIKLIKETGPLVAPSANPEGQVPAKNIVEAKKYFNDEVDFYEDGGELNSPPSTLVRINGDKVEVLRQGPVTVSI